MTLRRWEQPASAFDPDLQLVGSDNHGAAGYFGVRVPTQIGPKTIADPTIRNLFVLSTARFGAGRRARLVGFRQYISIGQYSNSSGAAATSGYPFELPVSTAGWRFVDGNVLWSIRRIPAVAAGIPLAASLLGGFVAYGTGITDSISQQYAQAPSLLLGEDTTSVSTLNFPSTIFGRPLAPEMGAFWDLRGGWGSPSDCSVPFDGPCDIAMFASIRQTNPFGAQRLTLPTGTATTTGLAPEDAFLSNFTGAIYWRVAGSLLFEEDDDQEMPTKPETERLPLRLVAPLSAVTPGYGNRGAA